MFRWLGNATLSGYAPHGLPQIESDLGVGYLLIEYIEETRGVMLSKTWNEKRNDRALRMNLFRSLSQIILAFAKVPLPQIGSFVVDDNGFLVLGNRPLCLEIQELENECIPVDIPRNATYSTVDSYVVDILALHDSRLRHQPNAVKDRGDCILQMSALAIMKAIFTLFLQRDLRRGPFFFNLTDWHQSNILVDDQWHIICLIDLEWGCSRPIEMLHPPRWLTSDDISTIIVDEYDKVRREFMDILEQEEANLRVQDQGARLISPVMNQGWKAGTFWYALALQNPTGLFRVFHDHIQPRLGNGHEEDGDFYRIAMCYWTFGLTDFINKKLQDKAEYDDRLRKAFEN